MEKGSGELARKLKGKGGDDGRRTPCIEHALNAWFLCTIEYINPFENMNGDGQACTSKLRSCEVPFEIENGKLTG